MSTNNNGLVSTTSVVPVVSLSCDTAAATMTATISQSDDDDDDGTADKSSVIITNVGTSSKNQSPIADDNGDDDAVLLSMQPPLVVVPTTTTTELNNGTSTTIQTMIPPETTTTTSSSSAPQVVPLRRSLRLTTTTTDRTSGDGVRASETVSSSSSTTIPTTSRDGKESVTKQQHAHDLVTIVPPPTRRQSQRNTQAIKLPNRNSIQYRRLEELFFRQPPPPESLRQPQQQQHQIGRFILQRVHTSPNVYIIDNFLTPTELQYLNHIATSTRQYQRSYVDAVNDVAQSSDTAPSTTSSSHYDTSHRTSTFVSFGSHQDAKCAGIETKAAELLGCWNSTGVVEPLQLVRYRPGQFFGIHHDLGDYNCETNTVDLPPKSLYAKRRIVTLFCYLNNVQEGGATYFPALRKKKSHPDMKQRQKRKRRGQQHPPNHNNKEEEEDGLRIEPVPGRAVLFANIEEYGQPDPRTIHAGEPVIAGIKYGLNIWICEE